MWEGALWGSGNKISINGLWFSPESAVSPSVWQRLIAQGSAVASHNCVIGKLVSRLRPQFVRVLMARESDVISVNARTPTARPHIISGFKILRPRDKSKNSLRRVENCARSVNCGSRAGWRQTRKRETGKTAPNVSTAERLSAGWLEWEGERHHKTFLCARARARSFGEEDNKTRVERREKMMWEIGADCVPARARAPGLLIRALWRSSAISWVRARPVVAK